MLEAAVDSKQPAAGGPVANGAASGEKPRDSSPRKDREDGDKERSSKDKRRHRRWGACASAWRSGCGWGALPAQACKLAWR